MLFTAAATNVSQLVPIKKGSLTRCDRMRSIQRLLGIHNLFKVLEDSGIPPPLPDFRFQNLECCGAGVGFLIRTFGGQRVKHVHNLQNAGANWN
jgi:hypothetical protein